MARPTRVIVVSPPELPRAQRLADELYEHGWDVVLADDAAQASRAADFQACLVVLTRDEWRDPAIVAAIRSRPAMLIPVLAEAMQLPQGPWTSAPVEMRLAPAELVRRIEDIIQGDAPIPRRSSGVNPVSRPRDSYPPSSPASSLGSRSFPDGTMRGTAYSAMAPNSTIKQKTRKKASSSTQAARVIFSLLVIAAVLVGARYVQQHPSVLSRLPKLPFLSQGSTTSTISNAPYLAVAPGADCDKGGAKWVNSANTSFAFACQPDGLLLTQSGNYATAAGTYFLGSSSTLATTYRMQVNAKFQSTEPSNTIVLLFHANAIGTTDKVTGGQAFIIRANGLWSVRQIGADGSFGTLLAAGVLAQPTPTLAFDVTANGSTLAITLNGGLLATVADATSKTNTTVGILGGNDTGSSPLKILFSQFSYTPIATPTVSPDNALATATALGTTEVAATYTAAVPGPGCDKGNGQWAAPSVYGLDGTVSCDNAAFNVTKPVSKTNGIETVGFYNTGGIFSNNYKISVTIAASKLSNNCASVGTRYSASGGYLYVICQDGTWEIDVLATDGTKKTIKSGAVAASPTYTVIISDGSPTKTLSINGKQVSVDDPTLTTTEFVTLGIIAAPVLPATASFSNFSLAPLP